MPVACTDSPSHLRSLRSSARHVSSCKGTGSSPRPPVHEQTYDFGLATTCPYLVGVVDWFQITHVSCSTADIPTRREFDSVTSMMKLSALNPHACIDQTHFPSAQPNLHFTTGLPAGAQALQTCQPTSHRDISSLQMVAVHIRMTS